MNKRIKNIECFSVFLIGSLFFLSFSCSRVSREIKPAIVIDNPNNNSGSGDSEEDNALAPDVVADISVENITGNSATVHYTVDLDASDPKTSDLESLTGGFVWGTEPKPTVKDNQVTGGPELTDILDFTKTLEDLEPNITYYVRVYVSNEAATGYSEEVNFTTDEDAVKEAEIVGEISFEDVSNHSALISFTIDEENSSHVSGNSALTETGLVWGTEENPTVEDNKVVSDNLWEFSAPLENLDEKTTYYVRIYAENEAGIVYGEAASFSTSIIFEDDFNRADVPPFDQETSPNPIDEGWSIFLGDSFQLKDEEVSIYSAAQSIMVFTPGEGRTLNQGGHKFKVGMDLKVSEGGSFGGIIFNAQAEDNSFYMVRSTQDAGGGTLAQVLRFGPGGTDVLNKVLFSDVVTSSYIDHYRVEVSSSEPGKLQIEFLDPGSHDVLLSQDFVDEEDPLADGFFGMYGFPLVNPYYLAFDNFRLEVW